MTILATSDSFSHCNKQLVLIRPLKQASFLPFSTVVKSDANCSAGCTASCQGRSAQTKGAKTGTGAAEDPAAQTPNSVAAQAHTLRPTSDEASNRRYPYKIAAGNEVGLAWVSQASLKTLIHAMLTQHLDPNACRRGNSVLEVQRADCIIEWPDLSLVCLCCKVVSQSLPQRGRTPWSPAALGAPTSPTPDMITSVAGPQ